jgi:hypothetical protein
MRVICLPLLLAINAATTISVSAIRSNGGMRSVIEEDNPFLQSNATTPNTTDPDVDGGLVDTPATDDTVATGDDDENHDEHVDEFPWGSPNITVSPLLNWPMDQCINNLTWIMDDVKLKGQLEQKKYILCPNTTYVIGIDDNADCCAPGTHHPFILRSYAEYSCGADGKVTNNCVITGGNFHIMTTQHDFPGEPGKGNKFTGITFEKATMFLALIGNEGEFHFDDCIFRVSYMLLVFRNSFSFVFQGYKRLTYFFLLLFGLLL